MRKYIEKRVLTSIFTLLVILLVLFILMQLMPGSPFNDEKLNEMQKATLYAKYGLDQPVTVQFAVDSDASADFYQDWWRCCNDGCSCRPDSWPDRCAQS